MSLFQALTILHVISGGIGLVTGTINIARKKGDKTHRLVGRLFFYGMLLSSLSALVMAVMHYKYFLFIVGIFTFYMTCMGQRYLSLKELQKGQKPKWFDWGLIMLMTLFGLCFLVYGINLLINSNSFGVVLVVFGVLSLLFVKKDVSVLRGNVKEKNYWLLLHLQRMLGAYIAAATAFLVVNNTVLPGVIAWLLPTVVIVPFIVKWSRKYRVEL